MMEDPTIAMEAVSALLERRGFDPRRGDEWREARRVLAHELLERTRAGELAAYAVTMRWPTPELEDRLMCRDLFDPWRYRHEDDVKRIPPGWLNGNDEALDHGALFLSQCGVMAESQGIPVGAGLPLTSGAEGGWHKEVLLAFSMRDLLPGDRDAPAPDELDLEGLRIGTPALREAVAKAWLAAAASAGGKPNASAVARVFKREHGAKGWTATKDEEGHWVFADAGGDSITTKRWGPLVKRVETFFAA